MSINNSSSVIQSPLKMRTVVHQIAESEDPTTCTRIYTVTETAAAPDDVDSGGSNSYSSNSNVSANTPTPGPYENYMIVNGTKMTDEMSAQILHDFSRGGSNNAVKYQPAPQAPQSSQASEVIHIATQSPTTIYAARHQTSGSSEPQIIWNTTTASPQAANDTTAIKYLEQRRSQDGYQITTTYHHQQTPTEFTLQPN